MCEKFGGDSIKEMKRNCNSYIRMIGKIWDRKLRHQSTHQKNLKRELDLCN